MHRVYCAFCTKDNQINGKYWFKLAITNREKQKSALILRAKQIVYKPAILPAKGGENRAAYTDRGFLTFFVMNHFLFLAATTTAAPARIAGTIVDAIPVTGFPVVPLEFPLLAFELLTELLLLVAGVL